GRRRPGTRRDEHHQQHRRVPSHLHTVSTELAVALAACAVAGLAFVAMLFLWRRVARLRRAQSVILGSGSGDLLEFAVALQARIDDLHRAVEEVASGLSHVDRRVDGSVTNTAVV